MFAKLSIVVVAATLTAVGLLLLRQQKFQIAHEMAQAQRQIDQSRQSLWELQGRVAGKSDPDALRRAIEQGKMAMEPIVESVTNQLDRPAGPSPQRPGTVHVVRRDRNRSRTE